MNKAIEEWEEATQKLADVFVNTYFEDAEDWWVADDVGGVLFVNDYFFTPERMVDAIKWSATFEQLVDYCDLELEQAQNERPLVSFRNYLEHGYTWIDEIKKK